jgi:signal peptidase II
VTQPTGPRTPPVVVGAGAGRGRSGVSRWVVFGSIAAIVVLVDQVSKALVTASLAPGQSIPVIGDLVRIVFGQNSGALFGLFKDNALMFGVVSIAVIGVIVVYHARSAASPYLTVTLGLLLGGAIGNMLDRLRLGYVVDFVDAGLGTTRFYTFNVADSAISLSVLLLLVAAVRPGLIDPRAGAARVARPARGTTRDGLPEEDPWDDEPDPRGAA